MPHLPSFSPLLTSLARRSRWALALVATVALMGCAGLPKDVVRPISTALPNPGDTALGQWLEARRAAQKARHPSGFVLLSGAQAAYSSRLALVDAAQKTLDLQYYAIHADASSERLLLSVAAAARRGVRVRLLLDDFHSTGRDALVMRLAFVPNVEMRMFNPLTGARGSPVGRMFSLLGDFSRVQQRMHNKLFIADNAVGVTGGRNLGDAYFGNSDSGNFVDLDVLAAGSIVQDLSRSFDSYWNNERAYPVQSLITREELDRLRDSIRTAEATQQERVESAGATAAPSPPPHHRAQHHPGHAACAHLEPGAYGPAAGAACLGPCRRAGRPACQDPARRHIRRSLARPEPAPAQPRHHRSTGPAPGLGHRSDDGDRPIGRCRRRHPANGPGRSAANRARQCHPGQWQWQPACAARTRQRDHRGPDRHRGGRPAAAHGPGAARSADHLALLCARA